MYFEHYYRTGEIYRSDLFLSVNNEKEFGRLTFCLRVVLLNQMFSIEGDHCGLLFFYKIIEDSLKSKKKEFSLGMIGKRDDNSPFT